MARNLTEAEIREVVSQVLNKVSAAPEAQFDSTQYAGKKFIGVFDDATNLDIGDIYLGLHSLVVDAFVSHIVSRECLFLHLIARQCVRVGGNGVYGCLLGCGVYGVGIL